MYGKVRSSIAKCIELLQKSRSQVDELTQFLIDDYIDRLNKILVKDLNKKEFKDELTRIRIGTYFLPLPSKRGKLLSMIFQDIQAETH